MDNHLSSILAGLVEGAAPDDVQDFAHSFVASIDSGMEDEIAAFFAGMLAGVDDEMLDRVQALLADECRARQLAASSL